MKQVSKSECIELFNEYLDDCFPLVSIAGYEYSASEALKSIDPIAYYQEYVNYLDACEIEEA